MLHEIQKKVSNGRLLSFEYNSHCNKFKDCKSKKLFMLALCSEQDSGHGLK